MAVPGQPERPPAEQRAESRARLRVSPRSRPASQEPGSIPLSAEQPDLQMHGSTVLWIEVSKQAHRWPQSRPVLEPCQAPRLSEKARMTRYPTPQVRLAERQPPAALPAKSQGLSSLE